MTKSMTIGLFKRTIGTLSLARYLLFVVVVVLFSTGCDIRHNLDQFAQASIVDSSTLKPSIILILPQSFKVAIGSIQTDQDQDNISTEQQQQFIALVNNIQNERDDQTLRQQYSKLSLQIRDAEAPITGQLFFEHVFDYFPPKTSHLLVPINLDQVSPTTSASVQRVQRLIVSVRPHQLEAGFGSGSIEFVSSAPVPIEPVPSSDGRRSFAIVQTDKPVYKPEDKVRIRALVLNENFRPTTKEELRMQIKNPQELIVEEIRFPNSMNNYSMSETSRNGPKQKLYLDHIFEFPPEPMLGTWSVHLIHDDPIFNDTIRFEVKEYTLPPYEIEFDVPKYILPWTQQIEGSITVKYHHGNPVRGKAQFKYGYRDSPHARPSLLARSSIKDIDSKGRVDFKIGTEKFKERTWFPHIAGRKLLIEVTITELSTGHRETAHDASCVFLKYPYRILFDDTIDDFKPSLTQQLTVKVVEMQTLRPIRAGELVVAQFKDQNGTIIASSPLLNDNQPIDFRQRLDIQAFTDASGRATFNIGPVRDEITSIQANMKVLSSLDQKQTLASTIPEDTDIAKESSLSTPNNHGHILTRHNSLNGYISLMNKTVTQLNVGDLFVSDLLLRDAIVVPQKIFYMVLSRGRILSLEQLNSDGLVSFRINDSMMPSIRVVLFALTQDSIGLLSDSMRINVGENLNCGLKVRYKSNSVQDQGLPANTYRPNDQGRLAIQARQHDLVSLIGVDSAVYTIHNRTTLESSRVINRVKRLDPGCGFGGGKNNLDVFFNAGLLFFRADSPIGQDRVSFGSSCESIANQLRLIEDVQLGYSRPQFTLYAQSGNKLRVSSGMTSSRRKLTFHGENKRDVHTHLHRQKREVDVGNILKRYKDPLHKACCRLGTMEDIPSQRNCNTRAKIVERYMNQAEFKACSAVYLDCCRYVFGEQVSRAKFGSVSSERSMTEPIVAPKYTPMLQHTEPKMSAMPDISQLDQIEAETLVRNDLRETWLFDLVDIESADGNGSLEVKLPHTITSWSIGAIALNRFHPICLMPRPLKLITFQEIFVQISMPYKVIQGEQIELLATIFNYSPQTQEVFVYMYGLEDLCSEAEPGERSDRKRLRLEKHSSQAVIFPMIPLKIGKYRIKILAVTLNSNHTSDIIERDLKVVPRGKSVIDETTFSLDPMNHQRRSKRAIQTGNLVDEIDSSKGLQRSRIRLTPTRDSEFIVPETQECIVSAIGDKMGQSVQTTLLDVENLIRLPHGCGEQVMVYLGPTLYTARYLSSINKLTGDLRWRAVRYIQSGYKRILNFRKEDGAFSAFPHRNPSIWLTAFVTKMLCQTERTKFIADEIHVDRTVVNSALNWLVDSQDRDTGTWTEVNPVYHREMLGGVLKENLLTAFVVVTLNECAHHSPDVMDDELLSETKKESSNSDAHSHPSTGIDKLKVATQRAEQALVLDRYKAVKERNPYVLALTAYALSFSKPNDASAVLNDLMLFSDRSHSRNHLSWRGDYPVETAAYALQALIELAPTLVSSTGESSGQSRSTWSPGHDAISISNWLSSRRSYTGAFESTQDTVVALEALSKLAQVQSSASASSWFPSPTISPSLVCNVTINNRTRRSIEFNTDNAQIQQTFKLDAFDIDPTSGEILDIFTSGNGLGSMSVKVKYNVFNDEDELCRFNIDSSVEEWHPKVIGPTNGDGNEESGLLAGTNNQSPNDTIEDKYFTQPMLSELNVKINQGDGAKQPQLMTSDLSNDDGYITEAPSTIQRRQVLRLRRYAPIVNLPAMEAKADLPGESWTSKMVSSMKSRLPSWLVPKSTTTTSPTSTSTTIAPFARERQDARFLDTSSYQSDMPSGGLKRNTTYRRSAQSNNAPVFLQSHGIPTGAKLNILSTQIDYATNDTVGNQNSTLQTQVLARKLVLLLRVCVHHLSTRDSQMSVIEIGILSGFRPNENDLKEIIKDPGTPAMKYEMSADKSLVVIYMHYIPSSGPYCLQFRLIRETLVHNLQSGFIRAYEYYQPAHSCSNFYTPTRINELLDTKCDSSGQVCQCASKSMCPDTQKLLDLSEIHANNATKARSHLTDLICSTKFDLISLVRLKNVRYFETGKVFKILVKVKSDLKGNLTKVMEAQKSQSRMQNGVNNIRKPTQLPVSGSNIDTIELEDESSLDYLSLSMDSGCVKKDLLLFHLAHPSQWKQGGELMILFARSVNLEKRYFKTSPTAKPNAQFPKPKPAIISGLTAFSDQNNNNVAGNIFTDDAQQLQYSTNLQLDKDSILHDVTYQAKVGPREAINNLILWVELRSRREKWICPSNQSTSRS